ncbi:circadian clock protein KaiC [Thalassobaculum salexigens]|uniref:circadian clock protein KaiC n=1 Tax=Thalassobaculum salexigens TaxID=455360 RepID=UPI00248E37DF|nr:circadian clock protein KaiC [Thalassobaculum salexigens]
MPRGKTIGKAATGIGGLDEMTGGGIPRGRVTLVEGAAGSGKTVLALQFLHDAARRQGEAGIFVAFEERCDDVLANAESFGWDLPELVGRQIHLLDARPPPDALRSGSFDLGGLLAALEALVASSGATRIVLDAIDVVLDLLGDRLAAQREIARLHDFLKAKGLTALVTAKTPGEESDGGQAGYRFVEYMVDCALLLGHTLSQGVSQRSLRILKYRGSAFEENAVPLLIGESGLEVAFFRGRDDSPAPVTTERVSSGVERLDDMLGGGYFRGASILLTGAPGTAKTTLCGTFAEAACRRGEKTLFVSFDSRSDELMRNLASVAIDLRPHAESGLLRLLSARAIAGSAETHLQWMKAAAATHAARCLVVDPLSALSKQGNGETSHGVAERLIDWAKREGITILCTSLLADAMPAVEGTPLQISTIADAWIHLSYQVAAGERNRGLSIIKARGSAHSNQVRELLLTDQGVRLSDVYTASGEVLMGTLRWQREREERLARAEQTAEAERRRMGLETEAAALEASLAELQRVLAAKRREQQVLAAARVSDEQEALDRDSDIRVLRGAGGRAHD